MAKSSPSVDALREQVQKLAAFEPQVLPVVSLYLNLTPDQHGRDNFEVFCRKAFAERLKAFPERAPERVSFERDVARIGAYLWNELNRAANGLALFACAGASEFFEAVQLDAPLDEHWLFVGSVPHIYPLIRLIDRYPRYAAVLLDTNSARIFVFGLGTVEKRSDVTGVKTRRTAMGGWSQARYQRHVENFHLHHIKEVVDMLERIVRADDLQHIIVSGDDVAVPMLKDALPPHLAEKLVDVVRLERHVAESEVVQATLQALHQKDAEADSARVAEVLDAWRSGGLAVAGPEATMRALQFGQVDELLLTGAPEALKPIQRLPDDAAPQPLGADTSSPIRPDGRQVQLTEELVTRAQQSGARVRIVENIELLRAHGGVAAALRFRL